MYNYNTLKESLTEENCQKEDNNVLFLKDYFMNYEREPQMEAFMGEIASYFWKNGLVLWKP